MPKILTSPVKRFPGTVTLPDSFTYPQRIAWEQALARAGAIEHVKTEQLYSVLSGIIACVDKWDVSGVPERPTPDTFPSSPVVSATKLLKWLFDEIGAAFFQEDVDDPNA